MAFLTGQTWYAKSGGWSAVSAWAATTSYAAGVLRRQLASPTVGNERVFAAVVAGTSGGSEPSWNLTQGASTTDGGVTWIEVTGKPGVNGDTTNSAIWATVKNTAVSQGVMIYDSVSGSLQLASTAGTAGNGSAPTFSATAGVTTADNTVTWTSLGLASGFSAWGAPWARLNLALATGFFVANNDTIYVSNNHAETQASLISYNALTNTGISIICVSDAAAPPTSTATTASVTTTGANGLSAGTTSSGGAYMYGLEFISGSGSTGENLNIGSSLGSLICDACTFELGTTGAASILISGNLSTSLYNCSFLFGATSQSMQSINSSSFGFGLLSGGSFAASGPVPSTLFNLQNVMNFVVRDADMSTVTGTLIFIGFASGTQIFENCKLNSGITMSSGSLGKAFNETLKVHNCGGSGNAYAYYYQTNQAVITDSVTQYRTGGASSFSTPLSWQIVTNANPAYNFPLVSEDIMIPNTFTSGTHTATIYLTSNTALTNANFWIEVEALGSASSPLGTITSTRAALLSAPTALTTDSGSTWASPLTHQYQMSCNYSPAQVGPLKVRLKTAIPSVTIFVDPLPVLA
jgi:hypothetical protein